MVEYIGLERELYTSSLAVAFFPLGEGVANFLGDGPPMGGVGRLSFNE